MRAVLIEDHSLNFCASLKIFGPLFKCACRNKTSIRDWFYNRVTLAQLNEEDEPVVSRKERFFTSRESEKGGPLGKTLGIAPPTEY